jgi:hypothetical protein
MTPLRITRTREPRGTPATLADYGPEPIDTGALDVTANENQTFPSHPPPLSEHGNLWFGVWSERTHSNQKCHNHWVERRNRHAERRTGQSNHSDKRIHGGRIVSWRTTFRLSFRSGN